MADRQNGRVQRFDLSGRYLGGWRTRSFAAGSLWIGTQQRDELTSSLGWLMKIDQRDGKVLGTIESYRGDHLANVS